MCLYIAGHCSERSALDTKKLGLASDDSISAPEGSN